MSANNSSSKKGGLPVTTKKPEQPNQAGLFVAIFLAAACGGFFTVNFLKMVTISHVHVSQGHALHKEAAFNAYVGTRTIRGGSSKGGAAQTLIATSSAANSSAEQLPYDPVQATKALSSRVCGSPAIDGYAYVDAKCLEKSPTVKWWRKHIVQADRWDLLVAHVEHAADYDGLAVYWGIGNTKATFEECAQQCLDHRPDTIPGPFEHLPCNAFAWCGDKVCFEPDAHQHTRGDCWLKFTEGPARPEVNMRGRLPVEFRQRHGESAPEVVQWVAGVLLPKGVSLTNGTMGPRWWW